MLRRSEGSAPIDFALVAGPAVFTFGLLLQVCFGSFQSAQLTYLAYRFAEYASLADSTEESIDALVQSETAKWPELSFSVQWLENQGVELSVVRLSQPGPFGLELNAEGIAIVELQD